MYKYKKKETKSKLRDPIPEYFGSDWTCSRIK